LVTAWLPVSRMGIEMNPAAIDFVVRAADEKTSKQLTGW
jgi:hypothetical protein